MKHKLIVFDWNGTILSDTLPSWRASNACLEFYGARPISLKQSRDTFTFPILHFYKLNGLSVDEVLKRASESNVVFQEAYDLHASQARTRRGARALLEWLKECGMSSIILSNYRTEKIAEHLERLKMGHYFQHIDAHGCDGTTILHSTTKTERLSHYMLKRGYKPEDVVIVGDSMEEPDIARHLGLTSIGITDGYISRARLRAADPDYIVDTLGDIRVVLTEKWALPQ